MKIECPNCREYINEPNDYVTDGYTISDWCQVCSVPLTFTAEVIFEVEVDVAQQARDAAAAEKAAADEIERRQLKIPGC